MSETVSNRVSLADIIRATIAQAGQHVDNSLSAAKEVVDTGSLLTTTLTTQGDESAANAIQAYLQTYVQRLEVGQHVVAETQALLALVPTALEEIHLSDENVVNFMSAIGQRLAVTAPTIAEPMVSLKPELPAQKYQEPTPNLEKTEEVFSGPTLAMFGITTVSNHGLNWVELCGPNHPLLTQDQNSFSQAAAGLQSILESRGVTVNPVNLSDDRKKLLPTAARLASQVTLGDVAGLYKAPRSTARQSTILSVLTNVARQSSNMPQVKDKPVRPNDTVVTKVVGILNSLKVDDTSRGWNAAATVLMHTHQNLVTGNKAEALPLATQQVEIGLKGTIDPVIKLDKQQYLLLKQ